LTDSARGEHTVSETDAPTEHTGDAPGEHVDVLIVGAGISGVGAAYHLTTQRPGTSFVVLETLESFGGTWLTHTYPGIRSDSDLYTFGYRFKPWIGPPIATAAEILTYMGEVIDEHDLGRHIRYRHRIDRAEWSSNDKHWALEVTRTDPDTGAAESLRFTCNFLWMCQGYYRHEQGYTPDWPGLDQYQGQVVHPQTWPDDIDLEGKRVVVIGSGATAATLVPNIADQCEHVTVLQRSPTYFWADRNTNELVEQLRELDVPPEWIHEIARRKVLRDQAAVTQLCIDEPEFAKQELINAVRARLPEGYDVDKHFTPAYRPWQQRLAFVPDGDLFAGISAGKASMVTDHIDTFTEKGIVTASGEELLADVVITATGFNMNVLGDIDFVIDDEPLEFSDTITYRGMMFTGVPNMVWVFGYFRASWTLRADLISDFVCRLLGHMEDKGARQVTPALRPDDADMEILPWVDPESFNPNYLLRAAHLLPTRGDKPEWQHSQDYWTEKDTLPATDLDDGCLVYK
jgi:cation diffusion facilitator CzcD-associated flavoprotein CzcO